MRDVLLQMAFLHGSLQPHISRVALCCAIHLCLCRQFTRSEEAVCNGSFQPPSIDCQVEAFGDAVRVWADGELTAGPQRTRVPQP